MLFTTSAIFSVLLVLTGVAKVRRPGDVERALRQFGAPSVPGMGLAVGFVEIGVGVGAFFISSILWLQGLLYLAFALWVIAALIRDVPMASCGCLGRDDTPPTGAHVFLNLVGASTSFLALTSWGGTELGDGLGLVAQMAVIVAGAWLAYLVLGEYAALQEARAR